MFLWCQDVIDTDHIILADVDEKVVYDGSSVGNYLHNNERRGSGSPVLPSSVYSLHENKQKQ